MTLRPATDDDVPALATIRSEPEVRRWWRGGGDLAAVVRADLADDELTVYVIEHDGRVIGAMGDNGTVKIDGAPFEDKVDNQPHVTCDFELEFFNFDEGQRADITLWSQPPSSQPKDKVVWSVKNRVISNDPASGAENDHDEVIRLSATDLDLAGLKLHEKQGYHIKLDVDLTDGRSSDAKHKVFWLQPCVSGGSPSPSPSLSTTTSPGTPTSPGVPTGPGAPGDGDGDGGGGEGGGSLPLTGVAATSTALTGLFLIGGGVALMVVRRRRDRITFTS